MESIVEHDIHVEGSRKLDRSMTISDPEPSDSFESETGTFKSVMELEEDPSFVEVISNSQSISLLSFQISGERDVNINYKDGSIDVKKYLKQGVIDDDTDEPIEAGSHSSVSKLEENSFLEEKHEENSDTFKSGDENPGNESSFESIIVDGKESDKAKSEPNSSKVDKSGKVQSSQTSRSPTKKKTSGSSIGVVSKPASRQSHRGSEPDGQVMGSKTGSRQGLRDAESDGKVTGSKTGSRQSYRAAEENDWVDHPLDTRHVQDDSRTTTPSRGILKSSLTSNQSPKMCRESCASHAANKSKCKHNGHHVLSQAKRSLHQFRSFREKIHRSYHDEVDSKVPEIYQKNPMLKPTSKPAAPQQCAIFLEEAGKGCQYRHSVPLIRGQSDLRKFLDFEGLEQNHDIGSPDTKIDKHDSKLLSTTTKSVSDHLSSEQVFRNNTALNSGKVKKWLDNE